MPMVDEPDPLFPPTQLDSAKPNPSR